MREPEEDVGSTPLGSESRPAPAREDLAELGAQPGLCGRCRHLQLVRSRRSTFARCALADEDPRFPRYPALPVLRCAGYAPHADPATPATGPGPEPERSQHG